MLNKGDKLFNTGRLVIGPFQFLTISLISSEYIMWNWISISEIIPSERIIAGGLYLAVLIAILVIFCVVYWIKRKYNEIKETNPSNSPRRFFIGPFQFLTISLISSEYILWNWMSISETSGFTERIVAGVFFLAVLIAVLVVFCVVYRMKKKRGDDF